MEIDANKISFYKDSKLKQGSASSSYFIENPDITMNYDELSPIQDVSGEKPVVLPMKVGVIMNNEQLKFYNLLDELLI